MKYLEFRKEINQSSIETLMRKLKSANPGDKVFVHSPGGEFEFFSIYGPAIMRKGIDTVAGKVESAAVLLYLLGNNRYSFPESTFFFHEVRTLVGNPCEPDTPITICDAEYMMDYYKKEIEGLEKEIITEWHRRMKVAQDWFLSFLSQQTRVSVPTFLTLMRGNVRLSSKKPCIMASLIA